MKIEKICRNCMSFMKIAEQHKAGRCVVTMACMPEAWDGCTIWQSIPKPDPGWPDEATRLAAKQPRVGDKWKDAHGSMVVTEIKDGIVRYSRGGSTWDYSCRNWYDYLLNTKPVSRLVSRGPEPVTLRDGDVAYGSTVCAIYKSKTDGREIVLSGPCDGYEYNAGINLLDIIDHIASGGRIVLAGKDEVAPVLSKELAEFIIRELRTEYGRDIRIEEAITKLVAAMDKGGKK